MPRSLPLATNCSTPCSTSARPFVDAPLQRVRQAKGCGRAGHEERNVPVLAQTHGPLQHRDGPLHVPLAKRHRTDPLTYLHQAEGIINGLSDPEPFFGDRQPRCERPQFGVAAAQLGPGRGRKVIGAKAFSEPLPLERRHIPLQMLDGPSIVSSYRNRSDPG